MFDVFVFWFVVYFVFRRILLKLVVYHVLLLLVNLVYFGGFWLWIVALVVVLVVFGLG